MTNGKCPDCSAELLPNAKFCNECGAAVSAAKPKAKAGGVKTKSSKGNGTRDMIVIVAVVIAVGGGYMLLKEPEPVPQKPVPQDAAHSGLEGMDGMMGSLPEMPSDYNGLVSLGNNLMDEGNYAIAAECYKRALNQKGDSPNVRTDFGACLHGMGLPHRAIEEFHKVIDNYPDHSIANFNLGIVHFGLKQADSAKYYWEKYLAIDPNGSAAAAARDYLKQVSGETN